MSVSRLVISDSMRAYSENCLVRGVMAGWMQCRGSS